MAQKEVEKAAQERYEKIIWHLEERIEALEEKVNQPPNMLAIGSKVKIGDGISPSLIGKIVGRKYKDFLRDGELVKELRYKVSLDMSGTSWPMNLGVIVTDKEILEILE